MTQDVSFVNRIPFSRPDIGRVCLLSAVWRPNKVPISIFLEMDRPTNTAIRLMESFFGCDICLFFFSFFKSLLTLTRVFNLRLNKSPTVLVYFLPIYRIWAAVFCDRHLLYSPFATAIDSGFATTTNRFVFSELKYYLCNMDLFTYFKQTITRIIY